MESEEQRIIANLIRWLGHPKPGRAMRARRRLVAIGRQAVEPLIEATGSPLAAVRLEAMITLAYIGDHRAFDAIAAMTRDAEGFIRYESAWALAHMCEARSLNTLIEMMQRNDDGGASTGAASFISRLGEEAVEPLWEILRSRNKPIAETAAYCLADIGGERPLSAIAELLDDPDEEMRNAAVESLARMAQDSGGAGRIVHLLEARRDDPSQDVRSAVHSALRDIELALKDSESRALPMARRLRVLASERLAFAEIRCRSKRLQQYRRRRRKNGQ